MTLLIHLSQELETRLKREASARALSPEDYALALLDDALLEETTPTPEEVVAKIKTIPPEPQYVHPATASVADVLRDMPPEPTDFDLEQWRREWETVEAEMKRIAREDDLAEGRG